MQLVLSGNRIIAHGENFLSMGGVVINTENGKKFDNCTIAECGNCPSDIDQVGYEYHGGIFVPCAPYGKGNNNGNFMEVCEPCVTPRNSGLSIQDYIAATEWVTIAEEQIDFSEKSETVAETTILTTGFKDIVSKYTEIAFVAKSGTEFTTRDGTLSRILVCAGIYCSENNDNIIIDVSGGSNLNYTEDTVLFTTHIHKMQTIKSTNNIVTNIIMENGQKIGLCFSSAFSGRVNGTFVLKARYKTDLILR